MTLSQRIEAIRSHFEHQDFDLAYSNLLDAILESENLSLFEQVIANEEWKAQQSFLDLPVWKVKCFELVDQLEQLDLIEKSKRDVLLRCENLVKTYKRGQFKLGPVSFEIKPGQLIGLVGENGNGKTTLLRILAQEISHDSGTLAYGNEQDFGNLYDQRTKLTYIPQRTQKWYGKIRTNLRFCATHYGITGQRNELLVEMMLIRFGLFKFRDLSWSELSSGYKMRFELARTFLRRPEILLLDEPLANLDVFAQQIVLNDLKSLTRSTYNPIGIVLSSQQLFEVEKVADDVLFLKNGEQKMLEKENQNTKVHCVVELETSASREELIAALNTLSNTYHVHFNGGMYVISDAQLKHANTLLQKLLEANIPIQYFRDISESSKRFFVE